MAVSGEQGQRRRVAGALALGLALLALALGLTLSGAPAVVLGANSTLANGALAVTSAGAQACQSGETLPAGSSAIRLTLLAEIGPRVSVSAISSTGGVLTSGSIGSGWTGGSVSIPVKRVARMSSPVRICFKLDPSKEQVGIVGSPTKQDVAARSGEGEALPGRIKIEYLRTGSRSWWSVAPEVARRMGLGHAPSGTWVALALVLAMGAVLLTASWLVFEELR